MPRGHPVYGVCVCVCMVCVCVCVCVCALTLAGAQQVLPAGPQQAGESGDAGGDLRLQQGTDPGAHLQQVVWTDVAVELHLHTHTHTHTETHRETLSSIVDKHQQQKHELQNTNGNN